MPQHLLEGNVDNRDALIASLEEENADLQRQVRDLQGELAQARRANGRAVAKLRHVTQPWLDALKDLHGELDAIGGDELGGQAAGSSDKWEAVKVKLAPRLREAIDLLLLQGTMRRTQIANALKMDYANCSKNVVGVLIRQGWVVDNGGQLSLRQL